MNNVTRILSVSALALALASEAAYADLDKTREQVQAELTAAQQAGDVLGPAGVPMRDIYPGNYPAVATGPGKTREQVQAELTAAQQAGDIIIGDEGMSLRELHPSRYPPVATGPGKTREQVQAELTAAQQNGEIVMSFAGKTERELFPGRFENTTTTKSQPYVAIQTGGKTREQVYAEMVAAQTAGDFRVGEDGLTDRERFPQLYRAKEAPQDVARAGSAVPAN